MNLLPGRSQQAMLVADNLDLEKLLYVPSTSNLDSNIVLIDNNLTQDPSAAATAKKPSNDPQIRRPAVPDQPLQAGPPAPAFQISRAGSQFGFSAPATSRNGNISPAVSEGNQAPTPGRESSPNPRKSCKSIYMHYFIDQCHKIYSLGQPNSNRVQIQPNQTRLEPDQRETSRMSVIHPENAQQFQFPPTLGGNGIHSATDSTIGHMNDVGLNIFAHQVQQDFAGFDREESDRPGANNVYTNGYYNNQNHMGNGQGGIDNPFAQINNHGIFGNFASGRNNFADPFEFENDATLNNQFLGMVPIPNASPRSEGSRAQDLFLPVPRARDNSDDEGHDDLDEEDDDEDIYEKRTDRGEHDEIESKHSL